MFDDMTQRFTYAMQLLSQYNYCKENNLDMAEIENAFNPVINSETTVLGKDMMSNYCVYGYYSVWSNGSNFCNTREIKQNN